MGFLAESKIIQKSNRVGTIPRCGECRLLERCKSPKMPVSGEGRKSILIVGEAPGADEDKKGVQFVGKSGRYLESVLREVGVYMRRDCWLTNSLACRPPRNETPTSKQIDYCRPQVFNAIAKHNPVAVILLGSPAVKSVIGHLWREDPGGVTKWAGFQIPSQEVNAWVCPTFHPSYVERCKEDRNTVPELFFKDHLRKAVKRSVKPWGTIPSYKDEVEVIASPSKAAKLIRYLRKLGGLQSFDYETNSLKPDSEGSKIICCSICQDDRTISFPWHGEAVREMSKWLRDNKVKKIGANIKFEDRWTKAKLGHGIANWAWDTLLGAHLIDPRTGITSVKFQAFALLGQPSYDDHIKPYLSASGGSNETNRVERVDLMDLMDLLLYCGLDSVLEYRIAIKQMKAMNLYEETKC